MMQRATQTGLRVMEGDVRRIADSDATVSSKVIKLWALTQIDGGGKLTALAGEKIRDLIGGEALIALFQITGFCLANPTREVFIRIYEES